MLPESATQMGAPWQEHMLLCVEHGNALSTHKLHMAERYLLRGNNSRLLSVRQGMPATSAATEWTAPALRHRFSSQSKAVLMV